jgi:hypothetical protein
LVLTCLEAGAKAVTDPARARRVKVFMMTLMIKYEAGEKELEV